MASGNQTDKSKPAKARKKLTPEERSRRVALRAAERAVLSDAGQELRRAARSGAQFRSDEELARARDAGFMLVEDEYLVPDPGSRGPAVLLDRLTLRAPDANETLFEIHINALNDVSVVDCRGAEPVEIARGLTVVEAEQSQLSPFGPWSLDLASHIDDVLDDMRWKLESNQRDAVEQGFLDAPDRQSYTTDRECARAVQVFLDLRELLDRPPNRAEIARMLGVPRERARDWLAQGLRLYRNGLDEQRSDELAALIAEQAQDAKSTTAFGGGWRRDVADELSYDEGGDEA